MKSDIEDQFKDQVEKRKREAVNKKIANKVFLVARNLSWCNHRDTSSYGFSSYEDTYTYHDANEDVKFISQYAESSSSDGGSGGGHEEVIYKGKQVFYSCYSISCYVPGPWEEMLEALIPKAEAARKKFLEEQEKQKARKIAEETQQFKDKWGL